MVKTVYITGYKSFELNIYKDDAPEVYYLKQFIAHKLKHLLDKQKDILLGDKNLNSFAEYDTLFHTTIVSYAQNTEFDKMFNNYMYRIKKLALDSLSHEGRLETTLKEHTDIFNNIANGCIEDIYRTTLIHMETPKYINLEDFCNNKLF